MYHAWFGVAHQRGESKSRAKFVPGEAGRPTRSWATAELDVAVVHSAMCSRQEE